MSWERYRRRYRLRQQVLADVPRLGPTGAVARSSADIDAEYGGLDGFLSDVGVHWDRTEQARIEAAVEHGESTDLARARLRAEGWPGRRLLDAFAGRPAAPGVAEPQSSSAPAWEPERHRPRLLLRGLFDLS